MEVTATLRCWRDHAGVAAATIQVMQCSISLTKQVCTSSQVFEEMKAAGNLKPTATTYGCLLMVCARQGDVDRAFLLYEEAYDTGVLATDECHNILIGICSDAGR